MHESQAEERIGCKREKKKITTMPQGYLRRRKKGDKNGDIIQMAETIRTKDTSI